MKYYTVFDENKPASVKGYPFVQGPDFASATFNCRFKAVKHAKLWLGEVFSAQLPDKWNGWRVKYGRGRIIEIRETE